MNKIDFATKREEFRNKTIDELLRLLADENLQTRFFAEMALRDLSGV